MEEFGFLWDHEENLQGVDELKQKLMYKNLELESVRIVADEEIKKSKEHVTSLLNLLKVAYQERDEARDQLQKLLNSSMTESNSQNSSPASSFLDPNMADSTNNVVTVAIQADPFESFVKGKVLPERGRLLQSVMEAGPLLANIMVAGAVPLWRNPPPLQPLKTPPVYGTQKQFNSSHCFDVSSCGSLPMLNFRTRPCLNSGRSLTSGCADSGSQITLLKRQRFF